MVIGEPRREELVTPVSEELARERFVAAYGREIDWVPNSMRVMARRPEAMTALAGLSRAVRGGTLSSGLKSLVGHMASVAAGCQYCAAHQAQGAAERGGVALEKVEALWAFETSPLFTEAERVALRFAMAAGGSPNVVDDELVAQVREHYDDDEIVELLFVICLFGFMNRWNDTLATPLEDFMVAFGTDHLAGGGWEIGRHARPTRVVSVPDD